MPLMASTTACHCDSVPIGMWLEPSQRLALDRLASGEEVTCKLCKRSTPAAHAQTAAWLLQVWLSDRRSQAQKSERRSQALSPPSGCPYVVANFSNENRVKEP